MLGESLQTKGMDPFQGLKYDKSKVLNNKFEGPKFLIIERIPTIEGKTESLKNFDAFLLKKIIDYTCNGEVILCKKLRNGTILVQTKNCKQAEKLIQLCSFPNDIKINITEHKSLNSVRGVVFSNELRGISDDIILQELNQQRVIKVEKILKRVNSELTETGLVILTFASLSLPDAIYIGYERAPVRLYIPLPLRCKKCFSYGHTAKACNNNRKCPHCANDYHLNDAENEKCINPYFCVNCLSQKYDDPNHTAFDRSCPVFLKEKEIQSIISNEKVSRFSAIAKFNERHITTSASTHNITYADKAKAANTCLTVATPINTTEKLKSTPTTRNLVDYADLLNVTNSTNSNANNNSIKKRNRTTILPRKTSKRLRSKMKNILSNSQSLDNTCSGMELSDDLSQDAVSFT